MKDYTTRACASTPIPPADENGTPTPPIISPTPLNTAIRMLAAGLWPVGIAPGTKRPVGKAWGVQRQTLDTLHKLFKSHPGAGIGAALGPGRGPDGSWLADVEGDGPEAEESRARLYGGEVIETLGWSSTRGGHQLLIADSERLTELLKPLAGLQGKGLKSGVYHLPDYPGLELRVGGYKPDGTVKQLQSVCPPTRGTDGEPRRWNGISVIAKAPESLYTALASAAAPKADSAPARGATGQPKAPTDRVGRWLCQALANASGRVAMAPQGERHPRLMAETRTLAGHLHYGRGFTEPELADRMTEAANRAAPERQADNRRCVLDAIADGKANPLQLPAELHRLATAPPAANGDGHKPPLTRAEADNAPDPPELRVVVASEDEDEPEVNDRWPRVGKEAFHGAVGELVWAADPHTESDPIATLAQLLVALGNLVDRGPHFVVGATRHYLNEFVALVGATASGRKGSSWDVVKYALKHFDPAWLGSRVQGGLVSGEGLIHHVRDPVVKEGKTVDDGVDDKRLLVIETEMGRMLKAMNRETNTLSDVIRQCWDCGDLRTMGKHSSNVATGAHVSLIAHVTRHDIHKHLLEADSANGFGNRFLWLAVRRSKELPDGGNIFGSEFQTEWGPIRDRLQRNIDRARTITAMARDAESGRAWRAIYGALTAGKVGLLGAILGRAEAHVMRLACLYAALDGLPVVQRHHMAAALALWDYCEASARLVFGDSLGDPDTEKLLAALKASPDGLTRRQISVDVFNRHRKAERLARMLGDLLTNGQIHRTVDGATGGRPAERWHYGRSRPEET